MGDKKNATPLEVTMADHEQVYKIDVTDQVAKLTVSRKINGGSENVYQKWFQAMIAPEVVRRVLRHLMIDSEESSIEETDLAIDWCGSNGVLPGLMHELQELCQNGDTTHDEKITWIEAQVEEYARSKKIINLFGRGTEEQEDEDEYVD